MENETYISKMMRVLHKEDLSKEDIIFLLSLERKDELESLYQYADRVRKEHLSDDVHIRGILEFSNHCKNDCLYCGIRRSNLNLDRYRLDKAQIIDLAKNAVDKLGFKTVLLQSGEDDCYKADMIEEIIRGILNECDCRVALSIGERSIEDYKRFFEAGARRCLVRFETSNEKLYGSLHPNSSMTKNSFKERIDLIKKFKQICYQVGTGSMIGLPGQTIEDMADDILLAKQLGADMVGMGPFLSHHDTPLFDCANGDFEMVLKMIAVTRLVCKDVFIPATTALQTLNLANGRQLALGCGANLLMPNITPGKYRRYYQLYPNKACIYEEPDDCSGCVKRLILSVKR